VISVSAAMKRRLARGKQDLCTIIRIQRLDGTILGFTDNDRDIVYNDGDGAVTYLAAVGYLPRDASQASDMSVDNSEYDGIINSPSITEADLLAGLWDYAALRVSYIDRTDQGASRPITTITRVSTTATATVASTADLRTGDSLLISGATQSQYNGTKVITVTTPTHFTYTVSGSPATPATGSPVYQTQVGALRLPGWKLGQVTLRRGQFTAEIRGIMQAYSRTIGEYTQPGCRANLGDARCKVNLAGQDQGGNDLTVTGTLTGVSTDQMTLYDSGRAEAGPTGAIVIQSISKTNPGHITLTSGGGASFSNGEAVTLSAIAGGVDFPTLNAATFVRNLSGDVFDLAIDTSAFSGSYTPNSGRCTPLGGGSGFFDFGKITMTSGLANGYTTDVLSYVPGQWRLQLPFPYAVAPGDTYTMVAGCDKSLSTCHDRYANVRNMRAEPYLSGIDKIVQIGKQ
jgi:hypothetical protein